MKKVLVLLAMILVFSLPAFGQRDTTEMRIRQLEMDQQIMKQEMEQREADRVFREWQAEQDRQREERGAPLDESKSDAYWHGKQDGYVEYGKDR